MVKTGATVRQTADGESVGPKMHAAVRAVSRKTYQSQNALAKTIGPNGSQDYGYRIIKRCLFKGLLEVDSEHEQANPHGRGAVVITEKGERYLNSHE